MNCTSIPHCLISICVKLNIASALINVCLACYMPCYSFNHCICFSLNLCVFQSHIIFVFSAFSSIFLEWFVHPLSLSSVIVWLSRARKRMQLCSDPVAGQRRATAMETYVSQWCSLCASVLCVTQHSYTPRPP